MPVCYIYTVVGGVLESFWWCAALMLGVVVRAKYVNTSNTGVNTTKNSKKR